METIKAERDTVEAELKSATLDMKGTFMNTLTSDRSINEPVLSVENLGQTFGPLQKQVEKSIEKQEGFIHSLQVRIFFYMINSYL